MSSTYKIVYQFPFQNILVEGTFLFDSTNNNYSFMLLCNMHSPVYYPQKFKVRENV